jgi:hypothetical protein
MPHAAKSSQYMYCVQVLRNSGIWSGLLGVSDVNM